MPLGGYLETYSKEKLAMIELTNGWRCEAVKSYAWPDGPGAEVDKRVRELRAREPRTTYTEAMHRILDADDHLKHTYAAEGTGKAFDDLADLRDRFRQSPAELATQGRGGELDAAIQAHRAANGGSYADGLRAVLADPANAALKSAYAGGAQ
jgi:hypothetical protein